MNDRIREFKLRASEKPWCSNEPGSYAQPWPSGLAVDNGEEKW